MIFSSSFHLFANNPSHDIHKAANDLVDGDVPVEIKQWNFEDNEVKNFTNKNQSLFPGNDGIS